MDDMLDNVPGKLASNNKLVKLAARALQSDRNRARAVLAALAAMGGERS